MIVNDVYVVCEHYTMLPCPIRIKEKIDCIFLNHSTYICFREAPCYACLFFNTNKVISRRSILLPPTVSGFTETSLFSLQATVFSHELAERETRQVGIQTIWPVNSDQDNSARIEFGTIYPGQFGTAH